MLTGILGWIMRVRSVLRMRIVLRVRTGIRRVVRILLVVEVIVVHLRIVRRHSSHLVLILVAALRVRIRLRIILRLFWLRLALVPLPLGIPLLLVRVVVGRASSIVVAHFIIISIVKQDPLMLFLGRLLWRVAGEEAALQQLQVSDARTVLVLFALEASHFGQQHCPLLLQLSSLLLQLEHIGLKHVYVFL